MAGRVRLSTGDAAVAPSPVGYNPAGLTAPGLRPVRDALAREVPQMPEMMRAALDDASGTVSVHRVSMPERFPRSALIGVRQVGICGSDLHMNNERTEPQTLPSGHEPAGEVVEVPEGETRVRPGDRVAIETIGSGKACERCWYCRMGQYRHCINKAQETGGAFADFMTRSSLIRWTRDGLRSAARDIKSLGEVEGLTVHGEAAESRESPAGE